MAKWSAAREEAEKKEKAQKEEKHKASLLAERMELFKKFRDGGWKINVLAPSDNYTANPVIQPDDAFVHKAYYYVKMPGASAMVIKTVTQLYRLAKGL